MFKKSKWQWKVSIAVIGIIACVIQVVAPARSADTSYVKLDQKLGIRPGAVQAELSAHEKDGYYLGTPYNSSPFTEANCMRPNGANNGAGGMNCTGFVASVLKKCGANLSPISNMGGAGGCVNAVNWFKWMKQNSIEYYHYNTVSELLNSGKAQKGDVIYFDPIDWNVEGADCHVGFFWGEHSKDNKFWHSATKPKRENQITQLEPKCASTVYLFKITQKGNLEIRKKSANPEITEANENYKLKDAEFTILRKDTNEQVAVLKTDEQGYAKITDLDVGEYIVRETKAPDGYIYMLNEEVVKIEAGQTVQYECVNHPDVLIADLALEKFDSETEENIPQGSASLEGAEFKISYYDCNMDLNPKTEGKEPKRTWIMRTDSKGEIYFKEEYKVSGDAFYKRDGEVVIPWGTLTIEETLAPTGYVKMEEVIVQNLKKETVKNQRLISVDQIYQHVKVPEQIMRGDLELIKVKKEDKQTLSNIPFEIISKSTGESHIAYTDENGVLSTKQIKEKQLKEGGEVFWFGKGEPNEEKGALPFDTYIVKELSCKENADRILLEAFEIQIEKDNEIYKMGTLENERRKVPSIKTSAFDKETGKKELVKPGKNTIIDRVEYKDLNKGEVYVMKGILMDKKTGEAYTEQGKPIICEKEFIADFDDGQIDMDYVITLEKEETKELVVFEQLYKDGEKIVTHEDLNDKDQTVKINTEKLPILGVVKTGDNQNLIVLILCALVSCAVILKYAIVRA